MMNVLDATLLLIAVPTIPIPASEKFHGNLPRKSYPGTLHGNLPRKYSAETLKGN